MVCSDDLSASSVEMKQEGDPADDCQVKARESWGGKLDFFFACIGFSVGLGNVWRFPYLCYKNGGGAFLIPYFLSVVFGAFPLFYMEIAVGQFMSRGGPKAWAIVPLFQGVGMTHAIIVLYINAYYNVIMAWALYYLFSSFTSQLPWEHCGNSWNTPNCSVTATTNLSTTGDATNTTNTTASSDYNLTDPVTEFWERKVLSISDGLTDVGELKWDLVLCLLLAWVLVYACICKGIKSSGKVMYFTATSPYLLMFILLIRNCTLDGASSGISYLLDTNVTKLSQPKVWVDAGTQVFFSWSIGAGTTVALGSYNRFRHNALKEAVAFSAINASTSFLAGFIVFSILGFMASQQNLSVADVAESGPGLAFIAYPKAVAQLPISPLWSVIFFVTLILLGLDSQFVSVESVVTAIVDQFPRFLRRGYRKEVFVGLVCLVQFVFGLSMVTEGGMYVFQILDFYSGGRIFPAVAFTEIVAIIYCYGVRRFVDNVRMMVGKSYFLYLLPYLKLAWVALCPLFCLTLFGMSMYDYSELTYQRLHRPTYHYPQWAVAMGWGMAALGFLCIPLVAVYRVARLWWMGGRRANGDFRLLIVPYSLSPHQRRPQDLHEPCLAAFEDRMRKRNSYSLADASEDRNGAAGGYKAAYHANHQPLINSC